MTSIHPVEMRRRTNPTIALGFANDWAAGGLAGGSANRADRATAEKLMSSKNK
jgi:hypothetical protein